MRSVLACLFKVPVTLSILAPFKKVCYTKMSSSRPTAGIIIIGDEILKGKVQDANTHFLCKNFYNIGINVCEVSIVADDVECISKSVSNFSQLYNYVITTGGVGPTHDDVTYEGIAAAFSERLVEKPELANVLKEWCVDFGINPKAAKKMGLVPQSSTVHLIKDFSHSIKHFPIVSVRNIYIFPGIPSYLIKAFESLRHLFSTNPDAVKLCQRTLCLDLDEFHITLALNKVAENFKGRVTFGSYPATTCMPYEVLITIESQNSPDVFEAEAAFREELPSNCIVPSLRPMSPESIQKVYLLAEGKVEIHSLFDELSPQLVENSINILEECFKRYPKEAVCLSFNGGKDCTALLHLSYSVFKKTFGENSRFRVVYISSSNQFSELEDFIQSTVQRYNLELIVYNKSLKDGLIQLSNEHPELKAILMGTRSTDPHASSLIPFKETDKDWPSFMRVCPILDWQYHDIWSLLLTLEVSYCSLYDKGYTSIGNKSDTKPNELLKYESKSVKKYHPAYLLETSVEERNGRS